MALSISPAVDKWPYQTDAFTIIFKAYDDNGIQCRGNQMSIQYKITYDGTMPDLSQMQRVYSDASGIIALVITQPCVISLYGIHVHDVNDLSKGEVVQEIAIGYEISFKPIILQITATYVGPDIQITENFNDKDLLIEAHYSDGTVGIIPPSDCVIANYQIEKLGSNVKALTYLDPLLGTIWSLYFTVNGIPKLLSIEGQYTGTKRILGDRILQEEILVYGTFMTSSTTTERTEILQKDWYFIDLPIITEYNSGILKIGYRDKETTVVIPYEVVASLRLNVWYEGAKIEVGKSYDPNDVIIYLVHPDGTRKRIPWGHCQIDSYLVDKEGLNWFTVTYTNEFEQISQEFPIEGIIYKDYIDLGFKVLYITDKKEQQNLTEDFKKSLMFGNTLVLDWTQFLMVVNHLQKYGLYIVTVPKLSGLSNRYDMDWEVLCIDSTTLKANVKKIYNEEEQNNGKEDSNN